MVAGGGAHSGQLQIGLRLMQPVRGTIHLTIVAAVDATGRASRQSFQQLLPSRQPSSPSNLGIP